MVGLRSSCTSAIGILERLILRLSAEDWEEVAAVLVRRRSILYHFGALEIHGKGI